MTDRYTRRIYLALAEGRDLSSAEEAHLAGCAACGDAADRARDFERALDRDLAERSVPLPADPRGLPADRPNRTAPALVAAFAAVVVITVGGGVALVALPPSPTPTPTPPAVSVTAEPSASPSEIPTPPPSVLAPSPEASLDPDPIIAGAYAQATGDEMTDLHDGPDGASFTDVWPGSDLWVVEVEGDWAQVEAPDSSTFEYVFGWVRVERLVLVEAAECDLSGDLWGFAFVHPQRQLECLADAPLVLEGYATGDFLFEPVYRGEPSWLAETPPIALSSVIGPAVEGFSLAMHLPPGLENDVPLSDRDGHEGTRLRITGHLDDPASSDCERRPVAASYPPLDAELSEQWCRQRFVVDSVEIVNED